MDISGLEQNVKVRDLTIRQMLHQISMHSTNRELRIPAPICQETFPVLKALDVPFVRTQDMSSASQADLIRNKEHTSHVAEAIASLVNLCLLLS